MAKGSCRPFERRALCLGPGHARIGHKRSVSLIVDSSPRGGWQGYRDGRAVGMRVPCSLGGTQRRPTSHRCRLETLGFPEYSASDGNHGPAATNTSVCVGRYGVRARHDRSRRIHRGVSEHWALRRTAPESHRRAHPFAKGTIATEQEGAQCSSEERDGTCEFEYCGLTWTPWPSLSDRKRRMSHGENPLPRLGALLWRIVPSAQMWCVGGSRSVAALGTARRTEIAQALTVAETSHARPCRPTAGG